MTKHILRNSNSLPLSVKIVLLASFTVNILTTIFIINHTILQ